MPWKEVSIMSSRQEFVLLASVHDKNQLKMSGLIPTKEGK